MVLAGFGFEISEEELRELCDCTYDGTSALQAMDAVRQLGFVNTTKQNLTLSELEVLTATGHFPIAFIDLTPIAGIYRAHAVVVVALNPFSVEVIDPAQGERLIPRDVFDYAWSLRRRLTLIVQP